MPARSAVERLPEAVRTLLEKDLMEFLAGRLQLDQVMSRLAGYIAMNAPAAAAPSRSSVHRYGERFAKTMEKVKRAQELRALLVQEVGPEMADGDGIKAMLRMLEGLAVESMDKLNDGEPLDPKSIHDYAKAIHHAASALKVDTDRAMKIRTEERQRAASAAATEGKAMGLSAEHVKRIEKAILGVQT